MSLQTTAVPNFTSTRNACKLCSPLGACLVLRGIEGCIPLIHGSQGCSTYIRRYGISHFREPIDIASSNFVESTAIFGGKDNLFTALDNVSRSYKPAAIGVTSTCLSETIGEDVPMYLRQYEIDRAKGLRNNGGQNPAIFYASTPSYRGTHMDGFHEAVFAAVSKLVDGEKITRTESKGRINLVSGFISAEDLRELQTILGSFTTDYTLLPDYSESLDGPSWETYQKLPQGGTKPEDIKKMGEAAGTVYFGIAPGHDAGKWLEETWGVPLFRQDLPIGIENCDPFYKTLSKLSGKEIPEIWNRQRGRLIDAYIDGHKYVNSKRAIIYGEEDFVASLASFLDEIGIVPVIAATGADSQGFKKRIQGVLRNTRQEVQIADDADFVTILEMAKDLRPDFIMGHSKGLFLSRELGIPLVRCGFPIHDRIGGQRILHLGYKGTLNLFDLVCNAIMEAKQDQHDKGYTYI
ncbi:nitrogenase component 1 [Leadbettera azotonutricia]|uniref:Nitrogenase molybdenum-iron protein beta chain (Nitrogenase component I) (Dinitrogenase) n=1 Tax=Leadbettera azotonutricia (strain ATCC BAA-888 / DSM 13862 / ZAS-9) TaxID=545695 RepID=F5Y9Q0_LEAAZ|nr:nitrogenase component 1 [Leadbettera azotonutricia]AEF80250.1 nitrogenase molybdenum-iron protein beta chain (Nitrogenase component I) (Dinitrogenase) [Leadbettera azotonutricia ZAS-9]